MSNTVSSSYSGSGRAGRSKKREAKSVELSSLLEKVPPHSLEAEAAVLGSMILDYQVSGDVLQVLKSADFYKPAHTAIYEALIELYDQHQSIDLVQLNQKLKDKQVLDQVGGLSYLLEIAESVPSAASVGYYADIVHEKALLRHLIEAAGQVLYDCYHSDESVGKTLDRAERRIFEVAEARINEEAATLKALLQETFDRLESDDGRLLSGLETGFYELDELTNGLQPGEMIIVAARPSMGKTAFALNLAEHIAATTKQPCAFFSLEMSKQQLAQRLLCSRCGVDSHKLRRNILTRDDFAKLSMSVGELSEAPLLIDDSPSLSILELRAKARRLSSGDKIKAVFVDYLQLMSDTTAESRLQEVSSISRGIKALARELNVPVICLSQLNRQPEGREGHRPRMSDLRESGSIEQDADVILMLHREEYYHTDEQWRESNPDKIGRAEVIITKQRNGPTGSIDLQFQPGTTKFQNPYKGSSPDPMVVEEPPI